MLRVSTLIALSSFALAAPAFAQDAAPTAVAQVTAPALQNGMVVISSDGRRVGVIDSLVGDKASPTAVKVIKEMRVISIPASSLSVSGKGRVVTTLAYKEIR